MSTAVPVHRVALPRWTLALAATGILALAVGLIGSRQVWTQEQPSHRTNGLVEAAIPMPSVVGYPVDAATAALRAEGFRVTVQPVHFAAGIGGYPPSRQPRVGTVLRESPPAMTSTVQGAVVTLFVYER